MGKEITKPEPELTLDDVREPVKKFAIAMEQRLRKNDWKIPWSTLSRTILLNEIVHQVISVTNGVHARDSKKICKESADIANFAMMMYDNEVAKIEQKENGDTNV
jgi:hypothetical protein